MHPSQPSSNFWASLRPYLYALLLLMVADGLMLIGVQHIRSGFPWALVSLLVVAAVANLWGSRPALLVLALSALFGDTVAPSQHISYLSSAGPSWHIRLMRALLFVACGGTLIGVAFEARRMRERAAQRREVVQAMQRMVLPETLAAIPGYDTGHVYRPARQEEEVGGDFYDVFPVDAARGTYGILMGDVAGKGKEAAAHTALLRYSARAYAAVCSGPGETLRCLNALVESQKFEIGSASLFVGLLHAEAGTLRYANAGHEPPLLTRAGGAVEALSATGPLVGILGDAGYDEVRLDFGPGDSLLLVTDGVTEARDAQGQFLDDVGVRRLLRPALGASTAAAAARGFFASLEAFMAGRQRDDIAILLLRRSVHAGRPAGLLNMRLSAGPKAPAKVR